MKWPSFDEKQPLPDNRAWTATFVSHDPEAQRFTYRFTLYEGDAVVLEPVIRGGTGYVLSENTDITERVRRELAHYAGVFFRPATNGTSAELVIDDVAYDWRIYEDEIDYLSFSNRGLTSSGDYRVRIRGENGFSLEFPFPPECRFDRSGWWRGAPHVTGLGIVRVIDKARASQLSTAEAIDALAPRRTLQDELVDATTALATLERDVFTAHDLLVRAMLAIGCTKHADDEGAIADWIAAHSDKLGPAARRIVQLASSDDAMYRKRSAIAFLAELCARVNVELGVSLDELDAELRTRKPLPRPWGIPDAHWWWGPA